MSGRWLKNPTTPEKKRIWDGGVESRNSIEKEVVSYPPMLHESSLEHIPPTSIPTPPTHPNSPNLSTFPKALVDKESQEDETETDDVRRRNVNHFRSTKDPPLKKVERTEWGSHITPDGTLPTWSVRNLLGRTKRTERRTRVTRWKNMKPFWTTWTPPIKSQEDGTVVESHMLRVGELPPTHPCLIKIRTPWNTKMRQYGWVYVSRF